jgi:hypothetical protein
MCNQKLIECPTEKKGTTLLALNQEKLHNRSVPGESLPLPEQLMSCSLWQGATVLSPSEYNLHCRIYIAWIAAFFRQGTRPLHP